MICQKTYKKTAALPQIHELIMIKDLCMFNVSKFLFFYIKKEHYGGKC